MRTRVAYPIEIKEKAIQRICIENKFRYGYRSPEVSLSLQISSQHVSKTRKLQLMIALFLSSSR